ncbi:MAG: glycoside hydrolase family 43 protein [Muribaculaceae bacterium]
MRNFACAIVMAVMCWLNATAQNAKEYTFADIHIRDPFVLADASSQTYYLYRSAMQDTPGGKVGGVECFTSKDLKTWSGPHTVFTVPADNWITGKVWAPEVHEYKGRYYLFATLNSSIEWKKRRQDWPAYTFRGVQVFSADSPMGPFVPFSAMPTTPIDQMALDGTLYVEQGVPYMVYCHEWVQLEDGAMNVVRMEPDLSGIVGTPVRLFNASSAEWSTGDDHSDGTLSYVTDGCFLYTTKTGKLLMIWSTFSNGDYAVGIAESVTGKITGPWVQQPELLFSKNGGHGMIFKSFKGQLYVILHGPNSPSGAERAQLYELEDCGTTLRIAGQSGK